MDILTFRQVVGEPPIGSLDILTFRQIVTYISNGINLDILTIRQIVYDNKPSKDILTFRQRVE